MPGRSKDRARDGGWYSPREVAETCGVTVATVWRWIRAGKLTAVRTGKQTLHVTGEALADYIRREWKSWQTG